MRYPNAFLAGLMLVASCGSNDATEPAEIRRTDLREWSELTRLLDPNAEPDVFDEQQARLERALWLEGPAQVGLVARGTGKVTVTAQRDSDVPVELGSLELRSEGSTAHAFDLPGEGARALLITLEASGDVQWDEVTLLESDERPPTAPEKAPLKRRNVIVLVADSLHAQHLGEYGYHRDTSPTIDRLAQQGVRFESAYSQTSWTLSSISSLFTSHTQERHGVLKLNQQLDGQFETLAELFHADGYRTVGLIQNGILWKDTGLGQGFDEYSTFQFDTEGLKRLVDRAKRVVLGSTEQPLFLYVHFTPPHQPYNPPAAYSDPFVDPNYSGDADGSVHSCARISRESPPPDSEDVRHLRDLYDGNIRYMDEQIRGLLDVAGKKASLHDSLVIFTSDHGEAFLQHGVQGHNAHVYEEMVHIPMIFCAPGSGWTPGQTISTPVSLLDVMPTLVDLFGLETPAASLDGTSLAPYLAPGAAQRPGRTLFYSSRYAGEPHTLQYAVRSSGYKLVVQANEAALYDLAADPGEQNDVSGDFPIRTRALRCLLGSWWSKARATGVASKNATPTAEVLQQLEGLGYVGIEEEATDDSEDH